MPSILIIDDDDLVKNMLKQTLERAGYKVETADNGISGMKWYQERQALNEPFDVVITDLIMPEMEGIETITALKRKNPNVKVIAISGGGRNSSDDYLAIAEKIVADKTFSKPLDRVELLQAVSDLIEASKADTSG